MRVDQKVLGNTGLSGVFTRMILIGYHINAPRVSKYNIYRQQYSKTFPLFLNICVNYMPECKAFECILGVHSECISILPPLLLWANIRQPMKSHLVKTPEHPIEYLIELRIERFRVRSPVRHSVVKIANYH